MKSLPITATFLPLAVLLTLAVPAVGYAQSDADAPATRPTSRVKGEITFDDLKFEIEKGQPFKRVMLTEEIEKLHDTTVRLRGFILPSTLFKETDINEFVLVRDNQECCFGPGAALYDCVIVNLVGGVTTDYTTRPVTVKGKFKIKEYLYPDGSAHFAIYQIEGTEVK